MGRVMVSRSSNQEVATAPTEAEHTSTKPSRKKNEKALLRRRQYQRKQKVLKAIRKASAGPVGFPLGRSLKYTASDRGLMTEARERQIWLTVRKQERRWLEMEIMPNKNFPVSKRQKAAFMQITRFEYEEEISNALCDDNDRTSQVVKDLFIMVYRERGRARAEQGIASHTDPVEDWFGPGKPPIDHHAVLKDDSMDDKYLTRPPRPKEDNIPLDVLYELHQNREYPGVNEFTNEEDWLDARLLSGRTREQYEGPRGHILYKRVNKQGHRVQSRRPLMKFGPLLPGVQGPDVQISTVETAEMSDAGSVEVRSEERTLEHPEVVGVKEKATSIEEEGSRIEEGEKELAKREDMTRWWEGMEQAKLEKFEMEEAGVVEEGFEVEEGETEVATPEGLMWRWEDMDETGLQDSGTDSVDEQPRTPKAQIMPDYYT